MKFYDHIFASAYNLYIKYYENSRSIFRSVLIVIMHIIGFIFLMLAIIKKYLFISLEGARNLVTIIGIIILVSLTTILVKYYNNTRVDVLLNDFNKQGKNYKRIWGLITIASLIFEYSLGAFLLKK